MTSLGTGIAKADDGAQAGERAAAEALEELGADEADFAFVFVSSDYDQSDTVEAIKRATGVETLIGSSSAGSFTKNGPVERGVAVGLLKSDDMKFFTGIGHGVVDDPIGAVREAAEGLPDEVEGFPHLVGINLHEGLGGKGESVSLAAKQVLDIPFSGGSAGDELEFQQTFVYTEDEVASDAVALAVLAAKEPFGLGVTHGHEPFSEELEVTEVDGSTVYEIDGRPALEVWKDAIRERVREEYDVEIDSLEPDDDLFGALMTRFEFGFETSDGNYKVRWPGLTAPTHGLEGPMDFAVEIPEGTTFRVMDTTIEREIETAGEAVAQAVEAVGGESAGTIVFECACHAAILGDRFGEGVASMAEATESPLVGFEAYGEVCLPKDKMSGYHNTTTSVLTIPE